MLVGPGNVARSGRDGSIWIWDTRCNATTTLRRAHWTNTRTLQHQTGAWGGEGRKRKARRRHCGRESTTPEFFFVSLVDALCVSPQQQARCSCEQSPHMHKCGCQKGGTYQRVSFAPGQEKEKGLCAFFVFPLITTGVVLTIEALLLLLDNSIL